MTAVFATEQIVSANKATVETLTALATTAFGQVERLSALNLNTARSMLDDSVAATRSVLDVKNPQDLTTLQTTLVQPNLDKAMAYSRSVFEIVSEGREEVAKLFEAKVAELNKTVTDALDNAAKSAPAGSEPVFAAVKSALGAANAVYDNVSKATEEVTKQAAKQATEIAEANVDAASEATEKAAVAVKKSA